jgi:spermidine synthase
MEARVPASSPDQLSSPILSYLARRPGTAILACFFCSGATGLIYEVVWSRRLALVFGATVLAVSTVLAAFLGGLALGSVIFGRIADRRRDPLRLYALLEGGVGLICFVTPLMFVLVEKTYLGIYPLIGDNVWLLRLVRFVLAALVLLVPTTLMGGTLPVLSRALVSREGEVGRRVAALYGLNTFGAVFGALAAGFLFIPSVGISGSIHLAAVLNLAIAAVAYAIHATGSVTAAEPEAATCAGPLRSRSAYAWLLVAYGLSGAAALTYEIGWTRVLSASFGVTTYAFSAMLAAFLTGIAIGSTLLTSRRLVHVDDLRAPLLWFGLIEVLIGLSVAWLTPLLDRMPLAFLALYRTIGPHFMALQFAALGTAILVMLLPAGLMGAAFPLVTRIATENLGVLGRRLSGVYAANTAGTVVGSFAAGFLLIPALGVRSALLVGVAINVLIGVAYLWASFHERRGVAFAGMVLAGAALVPWFALPDWNKAVLSSGAYVYPTYYLNGDARATMAEKQILYYRDALNCMISVTKVEPPGAPEPVISLQINGKTDASSMDLSTQLLFAHLPVLMHPKPEDVMLIGLASGCTLGALEQHPEVKRIDCVEIEPEMVRVTDFFRELNHDCLKDPRVRLTLDDARDFVLVNKHKYDVITSEPSNPWIAGVANLFTREFFAMCRERLKPGGIYCQWIPLYNLSPQDLRCIVATFQSVYPHTSLWVFTQLMSDGYLVGSDHPLQEDALDVFRRASRPQVAEDLAASGVPDPWYLLGGYVFGPQELSEFARGTRLNTDDFPVLEFSSPLSLYSGIARQTMMDVLSGAGLSSPPLAQSPESGRAEAVALRVHEPLRIVGPAQLIVQRDTSGFLQGVGMVQVCVTGRVQLGLGPGIVRVYSWPQAGPGSPSAPAQPQGPASRRVAGPGTEAQVWETGGEWQARWSCPLHRLDYVAVGNLSTATPERVLQLLECSG